MSNARSEAWYSRSGGKAPKRGGWNADVEGEAKAETMRHIEAEHKLQRDAIRAELDAKWRKL